MPRLTHVEIDAVLKTLKNERLAAKEINVYCKAIVKLTQMRDNAKRTQDNKVAQRRRP